MNQTGWEENWKLVLHHLDKLSTFPLEKNLKNAGEIFLSVAATERSMMLTLEDAFSKIEMNTDHCWDSSAEDDSYLILVIM